MPCRQLSTRHTSSWWPRPQASSWTPVTQPDHPSRRLQRGHTAGRLLRAARLKVWHNTRELHQARLVGPDRYAVRRAELELLNAARVADLLSPGRVVLRLAVAGFGVSPPNGAEDAESLLATLSRVDAGRDDRLARGSQPRRPDPDSQSRVADGSSATKERLAPSGGTALLAPGGDGLVGCSISIGPRYVPPPPRRRRRPRRPRSGRSTRSAQRAGAPRQTATRVTSRATTR